MSHNLALAETFSPFPDPDQEGPKLQLIKGDGEPSDTTPTMQPELHAVPDLTPEPVLSDEAPIPQKLVAVPAAAEAESIMELPPWRRRAAAEAGRRTVSLSVPRTAGKSPDSHEASRSDDSEILSYKSSSGSAWLVKWALLKQWAKTGKTEAEDRGEVHNEFTCGCMYCTVIRWS